MTVTYTSPNAKVVKIACSTGTETANAPTQATDGLALTSNEVFIKAAVVFVETAGTMTAGGLLKCYLFNPVTASWTAAPDLDLTVQNVAKQGFSGLYIPAPGGRIAYIPSGVGLACDIYIIGSEAR